MLSVFPFLFCFIKAVILLNHLLLDLSYWGPEKSLHQPTLTSPHLSSPLLTPCPSGSEHTLSVITFSGLSSLKKQFWDICHQQSCHLNQIHSLNPFPRWVIPSSDIGSQNLCILLSGSMISHFSPHKFLFPLHFHKLPLHTYCHA